MKLKTLLTLKALCLLACLPLAAHATDEKTEFLTMVVQGDFSLIGQAVNASTTYHGKVNISMQDGALIVKRSIEGKEVVGTARIESAAGGDAKVLRVNFTDNDIKLSQTCLIHSDLNNYARISCVTYPENGKAAQPGMEALFHLR